MKRAIVLFLILSLILLGCSSNIKITSDYTSLDFKYLKEHESYKYENLYHTLLADPREISDELSIISVKKPSSKRYQRNFEDIRFDIISAYNYIDQDITNDNISRLISENISFSSLTKWPSSEFLPKGFDPNSILEINKTPGLNVKDLHKKGINGEGVGIAIIDQTLFYDHSEYKEQIAYYEEMHNGSEQAMYHGSALASFTVGKNVGVAPKSKLYYIGTTLFHRDPTNLSYQYDQTVLADCINRVIEINSYLEPNEKIRVIAIGDGPLSDQDGYNDYVEAVKLAEENNIFVITSTSFADFYQTSVGGLVKDYNTDPNDYTSYSVPEYYYSAGHNALFFPSGGKTCASSGGHSEYEISHHAGMSWVIPWVAGFYALCCQMKPDITPVEFFDIIRTNGDAVIMDPTNNSYGVIVNPTATINYLLNNGVNE